MTETIMDLERETEEARGTDRENKKKMKNQEMRMSKSKKCTICVLWRNKNEGDLVLKHIMTSVFQKC